MITLRGRIHHWRRRLKSLAMSVTWAGSEPKPNSRATTAPAPVEVSSGGRTRHRLNLRGNRKLNHAIHIAAVAQFRNQSEGRIFYDRKITEGKTHKEAIRALKRRISDRVYNHLVADARAAASS